MEEPLTGSPRGASGDTGVVAEPEAAQEDAAIFRSSPVGMAVLDEQGRFLRVNPALCRFLGREAEELLGRDPSAVTLPDDEPVTARVRRRLESGSAVERVHKRYLRPDGSVVHGLVSAVVLGPSRVLAQVEDVTERVRLEDELHRLATHDPLTGLPGRRLLLERLREVLARERCHGVVAVVFVDLDAFGLINDALGHAVGDEVLSVVGRRFREAVREEDLVGRLAGDEFLVVAAGLQDEAEARALVERLEAALHDPVPHEGDEVFVSASLGLAVHLPEDPADPDVQVQALLSDADAAMYQAKRRGKRRYEVFDSAMRERAEARTRTAALLRTAVPEGRLVVHYQPVVHLPGRRPVGVEALVRLQAPDGRLLLPHAFLEVAEQTGVLPDVDRHVLQVATQQVQRWREETGLDLHLSVNAGAGQVLRSLPEQIAAALDVAGLPADRLAVELTEQTLVEGLQAAAEALRRVQESGVNLTIDDFGTGWASLTYLRRFPVTALKIDRSFVADLTASQQDRVVVRALADLARQLGLACVVEGLETQAQLDALLPLLPADRCYGQGYLFGPPVPADRLVDALRSLPE